jgi:hypothetical protein
LLIISQETGERTATLRTTEPMRKSAQPECIPWKTETPGGDEAAGSRTPGFELTAVARTTTLVPGLMGRSASPGPGA